MSVLDCTKATNSAEQVKRLARTYYKRLIAPVGASLQESDVEQEIWVVWCRVREVFDPSRGVKFSTLLHTAARNRCLEIARRARRRSEGAYVSLSSETDEGICLQDTLVDLDAESGEIELGRKQHADLVLSKMDPRLRQMVLILQDPPQFFLDELKSLQARTDYAKSLGLKDQTPARLSLSMLTELFGLSRCSRYRLLDEVKELLEND